MKPLAQFAFAAWLALATGALLGIAIGVLTQ